MWCSGSTSSTLPGTSKDAAETSHGPAISNTKVAEVPSMTLTGKSFRFRRISITSSLTPSMVEYSWATPSIVASVTAAPDPAPSK